MWICALNSHLYTIARGLDNLSPVLQVASRRRHLRKLKDYVNSAFLVGRQRFGLVGTVLIRWTFGAENSGR